MADGSIIIDTRIDTGGVSKGMNAVKAGMTRISAQVSKMGDSAKSSFQRQITAITGLYQNYEKQERKVSELKSKLEELSKVRIETEEYKKLKDDIKALEDEFEKVETKQSEWLDMGFSINSAPPPMPPQIRTSIPCSARSPARAPCPVPLEPITSLETTLLSSTS